MNNKLKKILLIIIFSTISINAYSQYINLEWEATSDNTNYYIVLQTENNNINDVFFVSKDKNNLILRDNINQDYFVISNDDLTYSNANKTEISDEDVESYTPYTFNINKDKIGIYYDKKDWVIFDIFASDKEYLLNNIAVYNNLLIYKPSVKMPNLDGYLSILDFKDATEDISKFEILQPPIITDTNGQVPVEEFKSCLGIGLNAGAYLAIAYHILIYDAYFISYPSHKVGQSFEFSLDYNIDKNTSVDLNFGLNKTSTRILHLKYNQIPISFNYNYKTYLGKNSNFYIPVSLGAGIISETEDFVIHSLLPHVEAKLGFGLDINDFSIELISDFEVNYNKAQEVFSYNSNLLSLGVNYRFRGVN